jgi:hypothetical protein
MLPCSNSKHRDELEGVRVFKDDCTSLTEAFCISSWHREVQNALCHQTWKD